MNRNWSVPYSRGKGKKRSEMIDGQEAIFVPGYTCPLPTFCFQHLLIEEVTSDGSKKIFPYQETETEA